jgi:hypothetical protein
VADSAVDVSAVTTWVVECDWAASTGRTERTPETPLWIWVLLTFATATVTTDGVTWLVPDERDDRFWLTPGAPAEPGGGATGDVGGGEPADGGVTGDVGGEPGGCPLPFRLGGLAPGLAGDPGKTGGPAGTARCGWGRWRCWPVPLGWSVGGIPPPNRLGGST